MAPPFEGWTFGVEFEFVIAYLSKELNMPVPDPTEKRKVNFYPPPEAFERAQKGWEGMGFSGDDLFKVSLPDVYWNEIAGHMKETVEAAGHKVGVGETTKWRITTDGSVRKPENAPKGKIYHYAVFEVVSPAYYFCPESLAAVEDFLAILTSMYCINVNETAGLHVHIGNGEASYEFRTVQKLTSFFWAFSPQLDRLHPSHRTDPSQYAEGMRSGSRMVLRRNLSHKRRAEPLQGLATFMTFTTMNDVVLPGMKRYRPKEMAYNLMWMNEAAIEDYYYPGTEKTTIEFRQHEACVDGIAVITWIETVVGIGEFCRSSSAKAFYDILSVVQLETWERRGDGLDKAREEKFGPILAEGKFTTIELLEAIKLWGPALYYKKRGLYIHDKPSNAEERVNQTRIWEYENDPKDTSSPEFKYDQRLRELWDALYGATRAQEMCKTVMPKYWTFDPTDRFWPTHDPYIDNMQRHTDSVTKSNASPKPWGNFDDDDDNDFPPGGEFDEEEGDDDPDAQTESDPSGESGGSAKSKPKSREAYDYGEYSTGSDFETGIRP